MVKKELNIQLPEVTLKANLVIPTDAEAIVIFSHGSGSSRLSPRNIFVAEKMQQHGLATLMFDLLTEKEDINYSNRFNIDLLTSRLIQVTRWTMEQENTRNLKIGYFGASTGAASALRAAAYLGDNIKAVVSRGGRPDLARNSELNRVKAAVLFLVGALDTPCLELNWKAHSLINSAKGIKIIPSASHLFEEPGKLEVVANLAAEWYDKYLKTPSIQTVE